MIKRKYYHLAHAHCYIYCLGDTMMQDRMASWGFLTHTYLRSRLMQSLFIHRGEWCGHCHPGSAVCVDTVWHIIKPTRNETLRTVHAGVGIQEQGRVRGRGARRWQQSRAKKYDSLPGPCGWHPAWRLFWLFSYCTTGACRWLYIS